MLSNSWSDDCKERGTSYRPAALATGNFSLEPRNCQRRKPDFFQTSPQLQFKFPPHLYGKGQGSEAVLPQEYFESNGLQAKEGCSRVLSCVVSDLFAQWGPHLAFRCFFLRIVKIVFKRGYYKYLDYWAFKKLLLLFLIKGKVCCRNGHGNKKKFSEGWRKGTKLTRSPY